MACKKAVSSKELALSHQGWQNLAVGDLADLRNGSAFNDKDWKDQGLPIIRIQNLNGSREFNYFNGDLAPHILVEPGDLLFSWSGNRGTSFGPFIWNGPQGVLNQHIFKVMPRDNIEKGFLFQALRCLTKKLEGRAHGGTGIVHIRKVDLESFVVHVPPRRERTSITHLLSSLDDAADHSRAVIDQMRRVKTALLQDLLTHGLPGQQNGQRRTRWLGSVPNNWDVVPLRLLLREPIRNGFSPNCPRHPTGKWILSLSAVTSDGFNPAGKKPAPLGEPRVDECRLQPGDIVVSRSNTRALVGLAGIYQGDPECCSYPDLLMRVRPESTRIDTDYLLLTILSPLSRSYFAQTSRGTSGSMKKIDCRILEELPIPLPQRDVQHQIAAAVNRVAGLVQMETATFHQLSRFKSALGQALLAGTLRVTRKG